MDGGKGGEEAQEHYYARADDQPMPIYDNATGGSLTMSTYSRPAEDDDMREYAIPGQAFVPAPVVDREGYLQVGGTDGQDFGDEDEA